SLAVTEFCRLGHADLSCGSLSTEACESCESNRPALERTTESPDEPEFSMDEFSLSISTLGRSSSSWMVEKFFACWPAPVGVSSCLPDAFESRDPVPLSAVSLLDELDSSLVPMSGGN